MTQLRMKSTSATRPGISDPTSTVIPSFMARAIPTRGGLGALTIRHRSRGGLLLSTIPSTSVGLLAGATVQGSSPASSGGSRWALPFRPGGTDATGRAGIRDTAMATDIPGVMAMGTPGAAGAPVTTVTRTADITAVHTDIPVARPFMRASTDPSTPDRKPRGYRGV